MNQEPQIQNSTITPPIETPNPSTSTHTTNKWLVPVVFFVVGILIGAGGYFAYTKYFAVRNTHLSESLEGSVSSPTPSQVPSATLSPSNAVKLSISGSLQDYMETNCKTFENHLTMDVSKLPISIDLQKLPGKIKNIFCIESHHDGRPITDGYIYISLDNREMINIYDKDSQELGHGGPGYLGFWGQEIFNKSNIRIGAALVGGEMAPVIGELSIMIRGEKAFVTKDGNMIYANYTTTAVEAIDERLILQLKPYVAGQTQNNSEYIHINQSEESKVINYFYGSTPEITTPEGKALQDLKSVLSGLTAK